MPDTQMVTQVAQEVGRKTCLQCGEGKPLSAFHRSAKSPDGYRSRCAACCCARQRAYKNQHADDVRARERARYHENPEKFRSRSRDNRANGNGMSAEYFREYLKANPGRRRAYSTRWNDANGEKRRAHSTFWRVFRAFRCVRPETCYACGASGRRIEAHHADYTQPLAVQWLCKPCHHRADQQRKAVA
jgi:hypothetical protein